MMNTLDYWLLDAVVTTPLPLSWLTAANLSTLLDRATHGASPATLAAALIRLCAEGWLGVYADPDFNEWVDLPALPGAENIYAALKNTVELSYALTADGGRQWEALSQPDWRRYVVKYEMDTTRLVSGSQQHLQTYLDLYPYGNSGEILVANSISWQSIQPWRATY